MAIFAIAYLLLTPLYMIHPRIARLAKAGYLKRERLIALLVLVMSIVEIVLRPFVPRYITAPIEIIYSIMGLYLFMCICKTANKVYESIMNGEYDERPIRTFVKLHETLGKPNTLCKKTYYPDL